MRLMWQNHGENIGQQYTEKHLKKKHLIDCIKK